MIAAKLLEQFLLGIATPLTAACVIPLYPAFIAYLASTGDDDEGRSVVLLGILVVAGVLVFMSAIGVLFTFVLQESVNTVVSNVSPIAFGILAVVGVVLLADPKGFSRVPTFEPPQSRYPALSAFSYGFFFGAIIIPCNPATISLFFARTPILYDTHLGSMLGFLSFGLGIGAPLLTFAIVSEPFSRRVTRTLAQYSSQINRVAGAILLAVSLYYLSFVFGIIPLPV